MITIFTFDDGGSTPISQDRVDNNIAHEHHYCKGEIAKEINAIDEAGMTGPVED
jgi:hypothetical protein